MVFLQQNRRLFCFFFALLDITGMYKRFVMYVHIAFFLDLMV